MPSFCSTSNVVRQPPLSSAQRKQCLTHSGHSPVNLYSPFASVILVLLPRTRQEIWPTLTLLGCDKSKNPQPVDIADVIWLMRFCTCYAVAESFFTHFSSKEGEAGSSPWCERVPHRRRHWHSHSPPCRRPGHEPRPA
jgi:hypothetical protein